MAPGAACALPPYTPELNHAIETLWRHVKYEDLPQRSFTTAPALKEAVEDVLAGRAAVLANSAPHRAPVHAFLKAA